MNDLEVFFAALDVPEGEQDAVVRRLCAGDELLLRKVQALLKANKRTDHFLDRPPTRGRPRNTGVPAVGEKPGDRMGRYKLLQQIGEGGWGVVFMAEQEEPVRRRVALKIVKPGMDTKSVVARFEAERQALAMMNHPNIAQVFDAGATASGRPYFVMELVRGVRVTDYCDQKSLPTAARLDLFTQICDAVQHAHQKGIAHRDIKPSNILVSITGDGRPLPKVIDFGIAKATTNQRLTDKTLFTEFEMLIGTPAYMSPEQAALTSVDVDARTDIYSLGVLLYELLTGTTPFDARELLKAGLDEVRRVIRDEEPVRPSTRLGTMVASELTTISQHRQVEAPKLIRELRGDLDWIVMKSLEKDPCRRYATANGLAMDIRRYAAGEPILARPPSKLYQFQKILLRNKLLFLGIAVIALLLVAGLIVVTALLAKERRARREAQQATAFLEEMLRGVEPSVAMGKDTTVLREMLDRTVDRVGPELGGQPMLEAELRTCIGRLYQDVGEYAKAEKMYRAALAINRKYGSDREVADSLHNLGDPLRYLRLNEAETVCLEALSIRRRLFGNENLDVASSLGSLALVYMQMGRTKEAETCGREALHIRQKLLGNETLETADSLRTLAILAGSQGRWEESEAMMRRVLATRRKLLGPEHPDVAQSLTDVAWAIGGRTNTAEAVALEQEALVMRQKLLPAQHPDIAKSLFLIGDRLRDREGLAEAHSILTVALGLQRELLGETNTATLETLRSIGLALEAEGNLAEAEDTDRKVFDLWLKRGEGEFPQAIGQLESLARVLMLRKKFGEAEALLDEHLTPSVTHQAFCVECLALRLELKARRGLWQDAAADATRTFELRPDRVVRCCTLAALLAKAGNGPAYEQFCTNLLATHGGATDIIEADSIAKACLFMPSSAIDLKAVDRLSERTVTVGAGDKGALPFFQVCKALVEYRAGNFNEAVRWAQKSTQSTRLDAHGHAYAVLALAYWQLGQKQKAHDMLAKGEALVPSIMPPNVAGDPGNAWLTWLYPRITLDEAGALIPPAPAGSNDSDKP